jgi:hypothetical protein
MPGLRSLPLGGALFVLTGCVVRDQPSNTSDPQITLATSEGATTDAPTTAGPLTTSTSTGPSTTTSTDETITSVGSHTTFCPCDCSEVSVDIPVPPIDLVFVLDKSGSMVANPGGFWDHDADDLDLDGQSDLDPQQPATPEISRWESLHRVVGWAAVTFDASLHAGLSLFPSSDATIQYNLQAACPVEDPIEVAIGPMQAQAIIAALPPAVNGTIHGATPGSLAVAATVTALAAGDPGHPRHLVYVTDGAANCNGETAAEGLESYDKTLHDRVVQALAVDAIVSHVVGLEIADVTSSIVQDGAPDNINNHDRLDELATQGGAPLPGPEKFHNAADELQLRAALEEIIRAALPCTLLLDPPPSIPVSIEISVAGVDYGKPHVTDCATEDGWRHLEPGLSIELCGAACRDYQSVGALTAHYRCSGDGGCC